MIKINPPTVHLHSSPLSPARSTVSRPRLVNGGCILGHWKLHLQLSKSRSFITAHQTPLDSTTTTTTPTKARDRKAERQAYLFAALASSLGVTSMAAGAVYYRFAWQMQGGEVHWEEMLGTFSLAVGATVGMEHWARWAHRALWHSSLWFMHESHHRPREGPLETNDVFAITNCIPAISLLAYGFFNKGLLSGLSFGAGLGFTVYGMAYMFVHDGLVHKRFPVGPVADVPYLKKVAAAHQLHHADRFDGVPFGLFLGPKELEDVGGQQELERLMKAGNRKQHEVGAPSEG
ncbi:beta-carotene 3-hydroxylase 1, chloroplastic-like [Aristolochia californica]|uniref:beta-carotene 3-hydroxylase 1, chloroplastic-like n=1 Tax=Aristolochia californica TaxID=171875 RepID=UPI0035DD4EA8